MQTHNPNRPYEVLPPSSPLTPSPFPQETNSKESSQERWRALNLTCSCTFGAYLLQTLLDNLGKEKFRTFNVFERTEVVDTELMMGYLSFVPLFAGLIISYFGIRKTFNFFLRTAVFGSVVTAISFMVWFARFYPLYLCGQTLLRGSILALWVAQIYMTIKLFKGQELSLAIGVLGVWKSVSAFIATQMSYYIGAIGLYKLLFFAVFICIFLTVFFLKRIDLVIRKEEEARNIAPGKSLNHPGTNALMVVLACFAVGSATRPSYFSIMFPSQSPALITTIIKTESFDIFAPIFLLPLFGISADKKNRRVTGVFSGLILLLVGSTLFYLFSSPESVPIPLLASTLFLVARCLFEVSFWAILGSLTPEKSLAVVLGIAFSLREIAPRFFIPYMEDLEKWIGFTTALVLIMGIRAVSYAMKEFKSEEESGKLKNDETGSQMMAMGTDV